MRHENHRFS